MPWRYSMAGHETIATILNYTLNALGKHQDVQEQLRAELEAFGRNPTYDDLLSSGEDATLPFLDAVTKEA